MSYNFKPYDQDQLSLMPPSLADWVEEDSLARFISEVVDHLEEKGRLEPFYATRRADGWGRASYHPALMCKVLLYGYCVGLRSSRKLERATKESVPVRYLAANQHPNFRTISDFRKEHREELEGLFVDILELCQEAGLAEMGRVALDGRKVRADAALEANRTRESLEREIAEIVSEHEQTDTKEDELYGAESSGDGLPEGLRGKKDRLRRLREAQARLEREEREAREAREEKIRARKREEQRTGKKKRGRKPKPPDEVAEEVRENGKANPTDPDSRIMKTRRGWVQGFNAQAAADTESQVIVAQDVTQEHNDVRQLEPMLATCEEQAGRRPDGCVADAGYWSEENAELENEATELWISTTKDWKRAKELKEQGPPRGRIPNDITTKELMERKLRTKRGREIYKERGSTIEPAFGQMEMRDLSHFLLRGLDKVKTEWSLFCSTHNLLKLWRSGWRPTLGVDSALATAGPG